MIILDLEVEQGLAPDAINPNVNIAVRGGAIENLDLLIPGRGAFDGDLLKEGFAALCNLPIGVSHMGDLRRQPVVPGSDRQR